MGKVGSSPPLSITLDNGQQVCIGLACVNLKWASSCDSHQTFIEITKNSYSGIINSGRTPNNVLIRRDSG